MSKFVVLTLSAVVAGVLAEPPSSYLPPQARNSLSSTYGAPNGGYNGFRSNGNGNGNGKASSFHSQRTGSKSFSYNSLHENQFGGSAKKSFNGFNGAPSQQYGAPSQLYGAPNGRNGNGFGNGLSQQYGAPRNGGYSNGLSQQYGAPRNGGSSNGFGVSQQYGAPSFGGNGNGFDLSQQYGAPAAPSNGFGVSQQYGAPSNGFGSNGNGFGSNSNGFSSTSNGFKASGNGFSVSQKYGAPGFGGSSYRPSNGYGNGKSKSSPAPVYGAPFNGYGYSKMDDDLSEPANYEYTYEVQAAEESGAEFGHQESREDESARGVYHVLLPDGRTQIVEYEADEEGFRPVIRYEEPQGYPAARGPQGPY